MQPFLSKAVMDERTIPVRGDTFSHRERGPLFYSDYIDQASSEHYLLTVQMQRQNGYRAISRVALDTLMTNIFPMLGVNVGLFRAKCFVFTGGQRSHVLDIDTQKGGDYRPGSTGIGATRTLRFGGG